MTKKIDTNFDYNEEIKKCKTIDDVMGKNGLIQKLVKDVLENILEGEMEEHLGKINMSVQNQIIKVIETIETGIAAKIYEAPSVTST